MPSLKASFDELLERIRQGRELDHASFEPIYYLVFSPTEILSVKRETPAWIAKLRNNGWDVHVFSIAQHVGDIMAKAPVRKFWLKADRKSPQDWGRANESIANMLEQGALSERLHQLLRKLDGNDKAVVLVTDIEALHPYMRIGAIEGELLGHFHVPTVFLYPGERTGKTRLSFLGFYPEDGNYRSVHVGG